MNRPQERLLDPFAFPSETKGRFVLLIVAALALVWSIAVVLSEWISDVSYLDLIESSIVRMEKFLEGSGQVPGNRPDPDSEAHPLPPLVTEVLLLSWSPLVMPATLLSITAILAAAIYLTHSIRIRLRYKSQLIPVNQAHEGGIVLDYIHRISRKIGLVNPPAVWFKSKGIADGMAFGLKNRETILLYKSPSFWENSWNEIMKSIVLHELAHIKNKDAQDRERVKAIWLSVIVILLLTFPLAAVKLGFWQYITGDGSEVHPLLPKRFLALWLGQLAILVLTIRWIWAGLIRARELYADWRVASWGMKEPLLKILKPPRELRTPWWNVFWGPFKKIWRAWELHPSHETRRAALGDPSMLFKVTPDLPLTIGFLIPILLFNLLPLLLFAISAVFQGYARVRIAISLTSDRLSPLTELRMDLLAEALFLLVIVATLSMLFLTVSYLTTKALGIQIQREAVADLSSGAHNHWGYARLLWPSFIFALGIELALTFAPMYTALLSLPSVIHFLPNNPFELLATAAWLIVFTLLIWLWMVYIRALTRFTIGTHTGKARPRKISRMIAWSATILLVVLSWPSITARWLISMAVSQIPYLNDGSTGYSDQEIYYKYIAFPLVVVGVSLAFYTLWAGVSLLASCHGLLTKKARCPSCNEISKFKMIVGRRCDLCDQTLVLWTHADVQIHF